MSEGRTLAKGWLLMAETVADYLDQNMSDAEVGRRAMDRLRPLLCLDLSRDEFLLLLTMAEAAVQATTQAIRSNLVRTDSKVPRSV